LNGGALRGTIAGGAISREVRDAGTVASGAGIAWSAALRNQLSAAA